MASLGKPWPRVRDEALCSHGVGHPIAGETHHAYQGIHGCDGCCSVPHTVAPKKAQKRQTAHE